MRDFMVDFSRREGTLKAAPGARGARLRGKPEGAERGKSGQGRAAETPGMARLEVWSKLELKRCMADLSLAQGPKTRFKHPYRVCDRDGRKSNVPRRSEPIGR
jgi:hypothetical protein